LYLSINVKETKIILCADDADILVTAGNGQIIQKKISWVVNDLPLWLSANTIIINTEEAVAVSFHTRQLRDPLKLKSNLKVWILPINQKQILRHAHSECMK
jgi:hypothetical protein